MLKRLRSWLLWFVTGSFTFLISACYGVMYDYDYTKIDVSARDKNTLLPIADLEVIIRTNQQTIQTLSTDSDGRTNYDAEKNYTEYEIIINDIDAANNGGPYTSQTNTAYPGQFADFEME